MLSINGRKLVVLGTSNLSLRSTLVSLWEEGVECHSSTSVEETIQLVTEHKPDFVLLAYDHPHYTQVVNLSKALKTNFNYEVMAFVEKDSVAMLNRLKESGLKYTIQPPLDKKVVLQTMKRALKENPEKFFRNEAVKEEYVHPDDMVESELPVERSADDIVGFMEDAFQNSLDQVCKMDKSASEFKSIKRTKELYCQAFFCGKEKGYIVGTCGEKNWNVNEKNKFWSDIIELSFYWLKTKGVNVDPMNSYYVDVEDAEFMSLALAEGEFVKTGFHKDFEVGISLFKHDAPLPHFGDPKDELIAVSTKDFHKGQKVDFEVFHHMPANDKFNTVAKPGSFLSGAQLDKFKENGVEYFYINQMDKKLMEAHYASAVFRQIIEDYEYTCMNQELKRSMGQQKDAERMKSELLNAKGMQDFTFPDDHFVNDDFEIRGVYERASECGGDWWFYNVDGRTAKFWIGDATGHGLSAAMVTGAAKSASAILKDLPDIPLSQVMTMLNSAVYGAGAGQVLMTFVLASLDLDTGELTYCNASHEAPVLIPQNVQVVEKTNLAFLNEEVGPRLGEKPAAVYKECKMKIAPGDRVVFYTDGVTELENKHRRQWGERKFYQSLIQACNSSSGVTVPMQMIHRNMELFRKSYPYADDVTMFTIQYKPRAKKIKAA